MNTLKNIAKKAIAIGTGAVMTAATIAGAAADLSEYPAPFVQNGVFNGLIVVGERAATADVLGSIEIASSLQAASTTVVSNGGAGTTAVSGDARQIGETNDILEIGEDFGAVTETLTEDDLEFLRGGVLTTDEGSTDFVQTIDLDLVRSTDSGTVGLFEDNEDEVGVRFFFNDGDPLFRYELEFTSGLESTVTDQVAVDLEDESLFILGQYFSIVRAETDANGADLSLDLIAGDVTDTLSEGDTKTYTIDGKEYEVTVLFVSDAQTAKFLINGETTDTLNEGDTDKVAGIDLGVREVLSQSRGTTGGTLVEFYIGANKIELRDGDITDAVASTTRPKINGETIEDATVTIQGSESVTTGDGDITLTRITYVLNGDAKSGDQDVYLKEGEGLRAYLDEPQGMLADNWDIQFMGWTKPEMTNIEFNADGEDQYEFVFTNVRNNEFRVPLYFAGSLGADNDGSFGDEDDTLHWAEINSDGNVTTNSTPDVAGDYLIDLDDYFIVTDQGAAAVADNGDVSYILQWTDVDASESTLTFQMVGDGSEVKARWDTGAGTAADPYTGNILVGGKNFQFWFNDAADTLAVDLDGSTVYGVNNAVTPDLVDVVVKGGGIIELDDNDVSDGIFALTLTTLDEDMDNDVAQVATISFDETLDEVQATFATGAGTWFTDSPRGEDIDLYLGRFGTYATVEDETDESNSIMIEYPMSQVEALVYVTGGDVQTTTVESGAGVRVNPIEVGSAVLDSDVEVGDANMIVVGGPCANTAAAALLGNPEVCGEGFVAGKGIIKYIDGAAAGGKVAILVAGYEALETQGAARVLAQYDRYDLDGEEVEVSVTTLSQSGISVN